MSERRQAIRMHLEITRAMLLDLLNGLRADDWAKPIVSSEGAWTVHQALMHLASAEIGQIAVGRRMLTGEAKLGPDFSLDFWNKRQVEKLRDRSPDDLLRDMSSSRQMLMAWIDGLKEEDFEKAGQHGRGDFITVEQLCYRVGEHEAEHTEQIRRAVGQ